MLPNENCFKVVEILEICHVYDKNDLYFVNFTIIIVQSHLQHDVTNEGKFCVAEKIASHR